LDVLAAPLFVMFLAAGAAAVPAVVRALRVDAGGVLRAE
jgi:hypothetical protein